MSDTPRTDEQSQSDAAKYDGHSQDYVSLVTFTRELERELNELKARHKTAILECTQYTPESWRDACEFVEPCAVWLDGPQMTQLIKDNERLDWILSNNMVKGEWETSGDDDRIQYQVIYPDREAIDKEISSGK